MIREQEMHINLFTSTPLSCNRNLNIKTTFTVKMAKTDHNDRCESAEGKFAFRNHIFWKRTSRREEVYTEARKKEVFQGGESKLSII